ncbi:MAG: hypothetical protein ACE5FU_05560 [Nitrospinota bacterium]
MTKFMPENSSSVDLYLNQAFILDNKMAAQKSYQKAIELVPANKKASFQKTKKYTYLKNIFGT